MQNWSPWQLSTATTAGGSMPQPLTGSGYPAPGADPMATMQAYMQYYNQPAPSGYTAEQWAAAQQQNWAQWQQWQQQYQQWQAQYGAKYQDAMKQMSSAGVSGLPPVPVIQPPPLPKENSTAKPPLPPDTASSYNFSHNGTLPPHQNNLPLFPSKNSANPPLPLGPPPPLPDNASDGLHPGSKRNANTDILTDSAKKLKNEDDELTEAERTFDGQFKQWEEQFNKWKQQNANHPDKAQYKQYEAKWTAWREKLIERRDQMRKKREAQRAKIEAEKKKNMPGGDKILNILSSTENQGLLNNLLGIGKTLGLTGKDGAGAQSSISSTGSVSTTSCQNTMLGSQQAASVPNLPTTMIPNMSQNSWATQQWPTQYNMSNMTMSGFSNFPQPPPLLSLNNQPPITSTMSEFNQPTNPANPDVNFSQPPPGFNTKFSGINSQKNQSNSRDQSEPGRRDGGSSNMPFKRDSYHQNQQNRFNDQRGPNDPFRGNYSFNRNNSRGMNSGGMEQGSNDGRNDFSTDRFANDARNFGSGGGNDFRSDSFAPKDRFNERVSSANRFGDDQDRFGGNRSTFSSNFDRGSQDRLRGDDRCNSGNDRFNSGNSRFYDNKDRFGGDKPMSDDRTMSGDRFRSSSDRFGPNINRLDLSSHSSDRRDNFGSNSRNSGMNERFDAPPEMSPELKALMEKRRAAQDVFKPSGSFLSSEKSSSTFGSLGESFRKITGNAPFLPRDRSGDRGRMSPRGSSSRHPPFGGATNSGPGNGPLSRPPSFAGGIDSENDNNPSSRPPPFGGGPDSGSNFKFHDDLHSRGGGAFRSHGPGEFDSRDMRSRMGDFGPRGSDLDSRGVQSQDTSQQKVPSIEVPPWIDSNMSQSPMGLDDDTKNLNEKPDAILPSNRNDSNEKDKSFVNPNAASSPLPELMMKKIDGLPFMGENDPKPEDLNMEPPPELPDLGPMKQTNQMAREIPSESKSSDNSFERPGNFFNGPFGAPGPFDSRGIGIQGNSQGSERQSRESNDPSFGMREIGGSNFAPRGLHDAHFGSRPNQGTFGPGNNMDDRFHRDSGDFGPGSLNMGFGPRNNEDFGFRNVNPPFGPTDHGDFGDRGPNPLLGPRNFDNYSSRAPQQFAPSDRNNFGSRDNNFGPRGETNSFRSSDHDGFDPRQSNMGPRPRNFDDFSSCANNPQFDMRDRAFGSDDFRRGPYNDSGPSRGELGPNFMPNDNGAQRPMPSIMNMDGSMNQSRGDMMNMDRDRPFDRFRNDMNQPIDKPMEDMRPPMAGPMPNPRDLDRRMIFPRSDMDREPHDPICPMNRDDRPFMRSDNMTSSGRPTVPLGPMQRSFDGPLPFKDALIDDPRNPFSRRIDPIQPTHRPVREFCAEKQFNYNHGGGIPNEVFNDYVPSKVIDYGHIRRPMMQDYATPGQCFDYAHGKFKLRTPEHEIFPKLDFKHWIENEDNVREYNEGMRDYELRKRHSRMLMEAELRKIEPRMDDRWKRDGHREFGSGRYSPWEKLDLGRNSGSRDFEDYRDYDQRMDTCDTWDKRGRGRSRERDSEKHREERICRSLSKDRSREKCERTRKDTDSELSKNDERSKGNVSRQENSSKTLTDISSPKDPSYSTGKKDDSPPKTLELGKSPKYTMVDDLLCLPGRQNRPPKIAIILRGPPGSGKSFVAKLIKDKELEQGGSAPRILSLDDYFLVEKDMETKDDNGKRVINKEMVYEYEEAMEPSYVVSLIKAFKKNITDGFFNFIILDAINEKISDYEELWSFAKTKGFKVYVTEMDMDVAVCLKRNTHKRTEDEINRIIDYFEPTPSYHQKLDVSSLLQDNAIQEVQMEEAQALTIESHGEGNDDSQDSQDNGTNSMGVSKWEIMEAEDKLDRLDGLKRKNDGKPQTMEDFLQVPDYYNMEDNSGKKRVRWADLEERKEQEKMRAVGFVVGQTNWDRMMDPTKGGSALTRTKLFKLT